MVIHYKNPRKHKRTICGHDSSINGRTYSNVTSRLDMVNCQACLNAIRGNKLIREMIKKGYINSEQKRAINSVSRRGVKE
jgi:hypothetical protein